MPDTPQPPETPPSILANLDATAPPEILYHYTDQRGLLGILRSKCIWATQVQYLNDQQELRHAIKLAEEEVDSRQAKQAINDRATLSRIRQTLQHIHAFEIGVASFSCDGDLLSQWRAYGGNTGGFAIGFAGPGLKEHAATADVRLLRCEYDPEKQKRIIVAMIDYSVALTDTHDVASAIIRDSMSWLRYAPALKNKAFEAEREWRLVTGPIETIGNHIGFREGRTMITLYRKIDIKLVNIEKIIVGPTVSHEQSKRSVEKLVAYYHPSEEILVELSKVPYRDW